MNSYIFLLSCSSRDLILIIPSSSVSPRIQSKSANTYWATILYQASAWILRAQGQKRNFDLLQGASHLRGDEYTYIHNHNAHDMWYFWGMYKTEGPFVQSSPEEKDLMDSQRVVPKGVEVSQQNDAMTLILWGIYMKLLIAHWLIPLWKYVHWYFDAFHDTVISLLIKYFKGCSLFFLLTFCLENFSCNLDLRLLVGNRFLGLELQGMCFISYFDCQCNFPLIFIEISFIETSDVNTTRLYGSVFVSAFWKQNHLLYSRHLLLLPHFTQHSNFTASKPWRSFLFLNWV